MNHSPYCTPEACSTFCDVRKATFAAATQEAKRIAIRALVTELGPFYANPSNLAECGWPRDTVERAVAAGWIQWTRDGNLEIT